MKRFIAVACILGFVWLLPSSTAWAADSSKSGTASETVSKTFKQIGTGTKKLVTGTVDLITLKPFRKKKGLAPPPKPWENNKVRKKSEPKKESFWSSLFKPKEEPKKVESMRDFVGLERPS